MKPVLVFGTVCIDRVRSIPSFPKIGGYSPILDENVGLGGEAANTATVLRAWGCPIILAGNSLGTGDNGKFLRQLLHDKHLPTEHLADGTLKTPICDIYLTPDGERTMFGLGFNELGSDLDLSKIPFQAEHFFTAEPNLHQTSRDAVRLADRHGMKVYAMDFFEESDPIFEGSYWQSSTDWVGKRGNTQKNVEWVKKYVDQHGAFTILSDGPNGLIAGSPKHAVRHYPPFPCPNQVDTTGAGDMFRAGMLFGLNQDWEIHRCLAFAATAGSLKCQGIGATGFIPSLEEIEEHILSNPEVAERYLLIS